MRLATGVRWHTLSACNKTAGGVSSYLKRSSDADLLRELEFLVTAAATDRGAALESSPAVAPEARLPIRPCPLPTTLCPLLSGPCPLVMGCERGSPDRRRRTWVRWIAVCGDRTF